MTPHKNVFSAPSHAKFELSGSRSRLQAAYFMSRPVLVLSKPDKTHCAQCRKSESPTQSLRRCSKCRTFPTVPSNGEDTTITYLIPTFALIVADLGDSSAARKRIGSRTSKCGRSFFLKKIGTRPVSLCFFIVCSAPHRFGHSNLYVMDRSINYTGVFFGEKAPKRKKGEIKRTRYWRQHSDQIQVIRSIIPLLSELRY